jgi:hypothetical protein
MSCDQHTNTPVTGAEYKLVTLQLHKHVLEIPFMHRPWQLSGGDTNFESCFVVQLQTCHLAPNLQHLKACSNTVLFLLTPTSEALVLLSLSTHAGLPEAKYEHLNAVLTALKEGGPVPAAAPISTAPATAAAAAAGASASGEAAADAPAAAAAAPKQANPVSWWQ